MGEIRPGETCHYVLTIAPIGRGNFTIGLLSRGSSGHSQNTPPPGLFPDAYVAPVHLQVTNPGNETIIEQDLVTPSVFLVDFATRGQYDIYIFNFGNEKTPMPVGVKFEPNNPLNREADKYLLALVFVSVGTILVAISLMVKFARNRQKTT